MPHCGRDRRSSWKTQAAHVGGHRAKPRKRRQPHAAERLRGRPRAGTGRRPRRRRPAHMGSPRGAHRAGTWGRKTQTQTSDGVKKIRAEVFRRFRPPGALARSRGRQKTSWGEKLVSEKGSGPLGADVANIHDVGASWYFQVRPVFSRPRRSVPLVQHRLPGLPWGAF